MTTTSLQSLGTFSANYQVDGISEDAARDMHADILADLAIAHAQIVRKYARLAGAKINRVHTRVESQDRETWQP